MAEDAKQLERDSKTFINGLKKLQQETSMELYAANIVLDNGEVVPMSRIRRIQNANQTKEADIADSEA